jgi:hypothetical protein
VSGRALPLALVLLAGPADAAELAGVILPDHATVAGRDLILNGVGVREATILMVDVYVAGLYLESKTSDPEAILAADRTKRLEMHFVRSVGREKLAEAWTEGFEKNAGASAAAVAPGLAKLNAAMADVKTGDVLALSYAPGAGVTVTVRGNDLALIPGDDFQRVLFSIWLGTQPPNARLREGLLGRNTPR